MVAKLTRAVKRETLNIRIKSEDRSLSDRAAHLAGKSRTDFLLEAGRREAENTLLDQTLFLVGPKIYKQFVARLDASPKPNAKLRRTMKTPAPWE